MKTTLAVLLVTQLACASQTPSPEPEPATVAEPTPPPVEKPPPNRHVPANGEGRIMGMGDIDTGGGSPTRPFPRKMVRANVSYRHEFSAQCLGANVESVIKRRGGAFRACYEQRLQVHPNIAGTVRATWQIGTDGKPLRVRLFDEGLRDKDAIECFRRNLARVRFDPSPGPCQVTWWFTFSMAQP
jgi:hypothetical protein